MDPYGVVLDFDAYRRNSYLSHNFHPYPAKYIPQIPAEIVRSLSAEGDWVLDPFCGSGTTLVESRLAGRNSLGIDINPLACLVTRVKASPLDDAQLLEAQRVAASAAAASGADDAPIPAFRNLYHWFDPPVVRELAAIRALVGAVAEAPVREFLSVAFSSIIVKVSNQESDTRYKAVRKNVEPGAAARLFRTKVKNMARRMGEFRKRASGACEARVVHADATRFTAEEGSFALAITSPPYMNSYDYYLYHKLRMLWLGFDFKQAQAGEFGSRNKHNDQGLGLASYNEAIRASGERVHLALRPGGYYVVVVGDAILRGELIKMNANVDDVLRGVGFKKSRELSFEQRRYTRAFARNTRKGHKESYILMYRK
jgi:DNA modification methylase